MLYEREKVFVYFTLYLKVPLLPISFLYLDSIFIMIRALNILLLGAIPPALCAGPTLLYLELH